MKLKLIGVALLSLALAVFGAVAVTNAQSFRTGDSPSVSSGEVVEGSAYLSGSTIDVAGTINGDLYCAGQNVTISGTVDGDILCAAQTINFTGTVTGDVRLAAQIITIGGSVDGSASIAGQTVTIENRGTIARDATILGQNTVVRGEVSRDLVGASGSIIIDAPVGRNVTVDVENLRLDSRANIAGTLSYTSPKTLTRADGATVVGKVNYSQQQPNQAAAANEYSPGEMIIGALMLIVSALIFALLFPKVLQRVTRESILKPSKAAIAVLIGFVAGIAVPVIAVLLMDTILALPFALAVLVGWGLIVVLSGVFAAYYVGRLVWRGQNNIVLATLVGALIFAVLLMIPVLNFFIVILGISYGSGVILMYLKNRFQAPKYDISVN